MKYYVSIQSVSDIITNSSSETFCKIIADKDDLAVIEDILQPLFGDEYEYDVILRMRYKEEIDPELCTDYNKLPEQWLEINMPYRLSNIETFYKAGLEAILKEQVNGQYSIIYEN